MICVTGAGGTVGSELIKELESAKAPFRAAYFSKKKAEAARAKGSDAVIMDYNNPEMLRAAFQGCDKLFLLEKIGVRPRFWTPFLFLLQCDRRRKGEVEIDISVIR